MPGASCLPSALLPRDEKDPAQLAEPLVDVQLAADARTASPAAQQGQQPLAASVSQLHFDVYSERHVLCPMTRLPDDLLAAALRCLHDDLRATSDGDADWYARWTQAVLCFSSVCKRWRSFAFCSPSLWNRIFVNMTRPGSGRLLDLQLQRSGTAPLDIWIYNEQSAVEDPVFCAILEHSARWRIFSVLHHPRDDDLLGCFQRPTPLLESFVICSQPLDHLPGDCFPCDEAVDFLPYAPKLRKLCMDTCAFQHLTFPRPSLRHVEMAYCYGLPPIVVVDVLAGCPSLQKADVHTHVPVGFALPSHAIHVKMQHLTDLNIGLDLMLKCTHALSLPALQSLTINGYRCDPHAEVVFQHLSHITTLRLLCARSDGMARLPALLEPLAKLKSLYLDGFSFTRDDFEPLAMAAGATAWIAPALTNFEALNARMDDGAAAACVRFVRGRTAGHGIPAASPACACLVHICVRGSEPDRIINRLRSAMSSSCGSGDAEAA